MIQRHKFPLTIMKIVKDNLPCICMECGVEIDPLDLGFCSEECEDSWDERRQEAQIIKEPKK